MHAHEGTSLIIILEKYIRKLTVAITDNAAAVGMGRKRGRIFFCCISIKIFKKCIF